MAAEPYSGCVVVLPFLLEVCGITLHGQREELKDDARVQASVALILERGGSGLVVEASDTIRERFNFPFAHSGVEEKV